MLQALIFTGLMVLAVASSHAAGEPDDARATPSSPMQSAPMQSAPIKPATKTAWPLSVVIQALGETRTRQWLKSLSQQCAPRAPKPVQAAPMCAPLRSLPAGATWDEIVRQVSVGHTLVCGAKGLMTGYYEPVIRGSLTRQNEKQVGLYSLPAEAWFADKNGAPWLSRMEISALEQAQALKQGSGAVAPDMPLSALVWIDDPVEAFFLHIQGSGRIELRDANGQTRTLRVGYAGHNGHAYRAIGAVLIERGEMTRESVSAEGIKTWLRQRLAGSEQEQAQARDLMNTNPRYIFFKLMPDTGTSGPIGALGVGLTDLASVAADPTYHPPGTSLLVYTARLGLQMVQVQDVGAGIRGAGRLDLFTGTGDQAGNLASDFKESLQTWELVPAPVVPRSEGQWPTLPETAQFDVAMALANCSGGM